MSSAFYMDVHVPAAITRGLRRRNVTVITAQEDFAAEWTDPQILNRATEVGALVFTMDEDFLAEAARRLAGGVPFSTVVFARPREITIGQCVHDLETIFHALNAEERKNQVIYLPL